MTHPTRTTLFFAGTDTDVGKTYTAALVARMLYHQGKRVGVYKPVASGCRSGQPQEALIADDAVALWEAAGRPRCLNDVCPQRFIQPLAPPQAARVEGKSVDRELLLEGARCWQQDYDVLIIEGAGGLFSPLADGLLNIDLVKQIDSMLLIVAANRLGVIHQTLSTCAAARHHGVLPTGIILCDPRGPAPASDQDATGHADPSVTSNAEQISQYSDVPLLGSIPFDGDESDVTFIQKLLN